MGKWISFQSNCFKASQFGLHQSGAGTAKRIKDNVILTQFEFLDVISNQVRWERQNKSIPIVKSAVIWIEFIGAAVGQFKFFSILNFLRANEIQD